MRTISKLWIFIGILAVLAPIGIILPAYFKSGPAWGEWGIADRYGKSCVTYIISAVIGASVIAGIIFLVGKFLGKKE